MLRVTLFCLSVFAILTAPGGSLAEQTGWSGLPEPTSKKEWVRAVSLRVRANIGNVFASTREAGVRSRNTHTELLFVVAPDGDILDVQVRKSSGIPALDQALINSMKKLPPLPAFTPDMSESEFKFALPIGSK